MSVIEESAATDVGVRMMELMERLYPICRSITGEGVRETLRILQEFVPLEIHEIPTGRKVFDWTVPEEWNIRDAWIKNERGEKVLDFGKSNLHVVGYSEAVRKKVSLAELKEHVFTLPDRPDSIPYRTSYYNRSWGFCMTHRQLLDLGEGMYEVCIDSSLKNGSLTYGELKLAGACCDEFLLSCHVCHPSLCNDNLSGIALSTFLAMHMAKQNRRFTYRFLFIPGTIGSITWLAGNESRVPFIKHGLVVACVGDGGRMTYKRSRRGNAEIDLVVEHVLKHRGDKYEVADFFPYGYDERQYCSPGFDLPVGCLMRTPHGQYPEYHTSDDNFEVVRPIAMKDSFEVYKAVVEVIESNTRYRSVNQKCEPQLGRRGLYEAIGGPDRRRLEMALLWVLNLADGKHKLLDMAERSGLPFAELRIAADLLRERGLLEEA